MSGTDRPLPRRTVLAGGALVAGSGALLAACGGGGGTTAAATATTQSPSATSSSPTSSSPSSSSAAGGAALAKLSDIPVGGAVVAKLDGKPVVVAQPSSGKAVCFTAICTHQGCTVAAAGKQLQCPCHGSAFDALTGKVLQGPATAPLAAIAVHVQDGAVLVGEA